MKDPRQMAAEREERRRVLDFLLKSFTDRARIEDASDDLCLFSLSHVREVLDDVAEGRHLQ